MKNATTSTHVLTTKHVLTVKVTVVQFLLFFRSRSTMMAALFESQILAKVKFDGKECTRGFNYQSIFINTNFKRMVECGMIL